VFVFQILLSFQLAFAAAEMPVQQDVDRAFDLILRTQVGKAICRDILGAEAEALELHLGLSRSKSQEIAKDCVGTEASQWIYPTSPADIRKLAIKARKPRRYKFVHSEQAFPIESWTDSFSNITTILTNNRTITFSRMVQILAHETAVYFDSKSHPLHPGADDIPHLRGLDLQTTATMNPLVAASNPLQGHTLTYLRALQVEFAIMRELVGKRAVVAPKDLSDPYLLFLVSDRCTQSCIQELLINTREIFLPFSLPLLAFSPHYRAVAMQELPLLSLNWNSDQWWRAQQTFNTLPVQFMKNQFTGDVVGDLTAFFYQDEIQKGPRKTVADFLQFDLWPAELAALSQSRFPLGLSMLEFLKRPLLSGYNISLASGPRVRVRTGNIE